MHSRDTEVNVVQLVPDKAVRLAHEIIRLAAAPSVKVCNGIGPRASAHSPMAGQPRWSTGAPAMPARVVRWRPRVRRYPLSVADLYLYVGVST